VLAALQEAGEPLSVNEIMAAAQLRSRNAADLLLGKMARDGEIKRVGRGRYAVPPDRSDRQKDSMGKALMFRGKTLICPICPIFPQPAIGRKPDAATARQWQRAAPMRLTMESRIS
jgi:hypothetical protein